ncbi:hypothetical protein ACWDTT_25780 [Streptosporangium sandarakinum]|uniref:Uncharacterized protein n=1 Tax=Streptosporangium sandarakinum TaxID=1260955 RepID=A0A852V0A7_9ACTN|nr:hypothetical protein [Streptosporangium sandarakinum]NYF40823.1 hypothetical protein [Streptosporangium sandarakinum]
MTYETAPPSTAAHHMALLRRALAEKGISTVGSDVMTTAGGHCTLSLAPGLIVRSVPHVFRWFGDGGMVRHPSSDPEGAAGLLVELFDRNPSLRRQREYLEALAEPAGASPV